MEIENKQIYKAEIRKKIEKYIKEFPTYFYGNIFVNLILILIVLVSLSFSVALMGIESDNAGELGGYGIVFAYFIIFFLLRITLRGFFQNVRILRRIQAGDYDFEIEDFEMDDVIEFIEGMPMKKEDLEQMRVALSFNKLIDVLETVDIIEIEKESYSVNLEFAYQVEKAIEEENRYIKFLEESQKSK